MGGLTAAPPGGSHLRAAVSPRTRCQQATGPCAVSGEACPAWPALLCCRSVRRTPGDREQVGDALSTAAGSHARPGSALLALQLTGNGCRGPRHLPPPTSRKEEGAREAPSCSIFLRARIGEWLPSLLLQITGHSPVIRYLRQQNARGGWFTWVTSAILKGGRMDIGGQQESPPPTSPPSCSRLT